MRWSQDLNTVLIVTMPHVVFMAHEKMITSKDEGKRNALDVARSCVPKEW